MRKLIADFWSDADRTRLECCSMPLPPITARPHIFYIRPAPGWLDLLYREVVALVETPLQKYKFEPKVTMLKGTVKVHRCDWRQGLEIMLRLTTAHDVEWLILESKCTQWSEVDAILKRVPWDSVLPSREAPVHVTSEVFEGFTTASAKLRENFCNISGLQHVSEGAAFRFKIELRTDILRISVSLCGDPLYKRGYKAKLIATAPLPEHQAAACIRWILAQEKEANPSAVLVPFAGSGTLGFEALIVLSGAGPGAFSREFACELFPCTPAATIGFLRRKLGEKLSIENLPNVFFNDLNEEAISVLRENVTAFSKKHCFQVEEGDFFEWRPELPPEGKILVLLNPPYGNRLARNSSISDLYGRIGASVRENLGRYPGRVLGGCICPDELSWRSFLRELRNAKAETHHFTHGGNEMRLVRWSG